ncbi:hypothetical protein B484DRAFT_401136 [Ochromonadaceae sp. CCMP2298]|nr:hypothetical protein B484DRAFT_401136 [Ochromonadaceae sp. CCMP2298]
MTLSGDQENERPNHGGMTRAELDALLYAPGTAPFQPLLASNSTSAPSSELGPPSEGALVWIQTTPAIEGPPLPVT